MPTPYAGRTQHPLQGRTTSEYEAQKALLDFELEQKRQEILKYLGYRSPSGQQIMGQLEIDLGRQTSDLERSRALAVEEVTNAMRDQGTLFSGIRTRLQGRQEYPFIQSLARTKEDTSRSLVELMQKLADLERERSVRMGLILADTARQRAASQQASYFGG